MQISLRLQALCRSENIRIKEERLAKLTWGNYSCIDRELELVYIKPSGINPSHILDSDISVVDLNGNHLSGLNPSVDTAIHLAIYNSNPEVSSICHSHSTYATAYAQSCKDILQRGTTHCDTFHKKISAISPPKEIYEAGKSHEKALGEFISFESCKDSSGAVLVAFHGPFVWSKDANAVDLAIALEEIAKISFLSETLGCSLELPEEISKFHWSRKHGREKWYGQDRN